VIAASPSGRKLDLACGQRPREGFEGVDIWEGAQHVVDLMTYPWPFADSSIAELRSSHFAEHIPMVHVDERGQPVAHGGQDALFRFMDEAWRVLVPGGLFTVIVPAGRSNRAFQDPTHRRFFVEETFAYFSAAWRKSQLLDHYNVKCDFDVNVQTTVDSVLNTKHPQVAQRELRNYWNTAIDFHAFMKAIKP
jgi:predicted SAM-dependent methyltransferase